MNRVSNKNGVLHVSMKHRCEHFWVFFADILQLQWFDVLYMPRRNTYKCFKAVCKVSGWQVLIFLHDTMKWNLQVLPPSPPASERYNLGSLENISQIIFQMVLVNYARFTTNAVQRPGDLGLLINWFHQRALARAGILVMRAGSPRSNYHWWIWKDIFSCSTMPWPYGPFSPW